MHIQFSYHVISWVEIRLSYFYCVKISHYSIFINNIILKYSPCILKPSK